MHLINDIDLIFPLCRRIFHFLANLADVVHAVVGRGVQLDHVEDRPVVDAAAGGAPVARVAVDRMLAVDRLGQDLGTGGLAGPARADEQVGMGQTPGLDLLFERLGNMLLTDDVVKGLRAVFAVRVI
mgnify:CR=1 FL=1